MIEKKRPRLLKGKGGVKEGPRGDPPSDQRDLGYRYSGNVKGVTLRTRGVVEGPRRENCLYYGLRLLSHPPHQTVRVQ